MLQAWRHSRISSDKKKLQAACGEHSLQAFYFVRKSAFYLTIRAKDSKMLGQIKYYTLNIKEVISL